MNSYLTKLLFYSAAILFLAVLTTNLLSLDDGITGLTQKNGGVGCVCHGLHAPDTTVSVLFRGPDSVAVNQSVYYQLRIAGGPHVACGLDVAVGHGVLDTAGFETGTRRQWQVYTQTDSGYEITHNIPKPCTSDTLIFTFNYTAPNYAGYDTLFGNGNSVNGNDTADESDRWNFAPNKRIRIYNPIGIENISTIANSFSLGQNFPNPFNPSTTIDFEIPPAGQKNAFDVILKIYDINGRLVNTLVNKNLRTGSYKVTFDAGGLPSGAYFYRLQAGDFIQTRKMILIK